MTEISRLFGLFALSAAVTGGCTKQDKNSLPKPVDKPSKHQIRYYEDYLLGGNDSLCSDFVGFGWWEDKEFEGQPKRLYHQEMYAMDGPLTDSNGVPIRDWKVTSLNDGKEAADTMKILERSGRTIYLKAPANAIQRAINSNTSDTIDYYPKENATFCLFYANSHLADRVKNDSAAAYEVQSRLRNVWYLPRVQGFINP